MEIDWNRVAVTSDVRHADGRIKVQSGAVGTICSQEQGIARIAFDEGQDAHIDRCGGNRLIQAVPLIDTWPVGMIKAGFGCPELAVQLQ